MSDKLLPVRDSSLKFGKWSQIRDGIDILDIPISINRKEVII